MGETFDLLVHAIPKEKFAHVNDSRVKVASALVKERSIRDLMRERMFEGIFKIWEERGLLEEFGRLEAVELSTQRLIR
jgi:hypothetical protein